MSTICIDWRGNSAAKRSQIRMLWKFNCSEGDFSIEEQISFLVEHIRFLYLLIGLVIEDIPFTSNALRISNIVPRC